MMITADIFFSVIAPATASSGSEGPRWNQDFSRCAFNRTSREVGWSKAVELVKVARRDKEDFDCATWLHKARELSKEGFKGPVEHHLTGKETEPWEIIYFKVYKSQLPVVEQAWKRLV